MNSQLIQQGRAAYRAGDFSAAAQMLGAAKTPGEIMGEADHLRGNALMHLGMYAEAAEAYAAALNDGTYGKRGALLTNRGKALAAVGDYVTAAQAFSAATQDASYATPFKAYLGLGNALFQSGDFANAGTAFRQAAIDGANPAPAAALGELGRCFIKLGRPADAVETYRTAIDFAGPRDDTRALNAGMGEALSAAGRPSEALDAFNAATADGIYQLTPEQADELARVHDSLAALSAQTAMAMATAPAPAMETTAVDSLDPTGATGQFMPDPSDTGFFTLSESEMVQQDRQDRKQAKVRRRHRHTGLKVFLVLLLLIVLAAGGLGFAYTRGMGIPSQESVITDLFQAAGDGDTAKAESCLASSLSEDAKAMIISSIPQGATVSVEGMDQSMTETTAKVKASLSKGGEQEYTVKFVRSDNHIGWAVSSLDIDFSAADNQ
ncbi:tetratricopeptide repeat protein [Collinsella sp. HCP3S3_A7]|uniref:tetratricopeptide repeat protein n=1 Tax=unclassified Collinsella TaxID=2637548 RepID=UPI003F897954